ncbi:methyltransferase family protein [Streptomyces sp. NBC_00239]|uniref:methyltransferase family protein n=1 Tax=Streptomyces sp. NBC_00239 TaxID=2903640 RepID=UPI002E2D9E21|nr:isoprenylcysteine carboxylmethyltransferase family protein [Streptomyces sp. NBC_00239]
MAVLALSLYGAFLLIAGPLRAGIQYRRTGDTGARHGRLGTAQWWGSIAPGLGSLLAGILAPAAEITGLVHPLPGLDGMPVRITGVVLAVLGIAATFTAQLAMGASWRIGVAPGETTALVTTGPFKLVRNPIYTAAILTVSGLALMVPNPLALAGLAATVIGIEITVRLVEEPYLLRVHGAAYAGYAARTGRFLPRLGRLSAPRPPG